MSSIFISHSSKDNAMAALVKEKLEEAGHTSIFLDFDPEDGIPAGVSWERTLYAQLKSCQAVVVLCSQYSMNSSWCFVEMAYTRSLGKGLFPIQLTDPRDSDAGYSVPTMLNEVQILKLYRLGEDETFARLLHGLKEAGLDPNDAFDWDNTRPPYPGLLSFEAEDAAIYFGRDKEINAGRELLNRLRNFGGTRLVLTLGASGSGKSSLVKAGLLPRLKKDQSNWLVMNPFRPRRNPMLEFSHVVQTCFKQADAVEEWQDAQQLLRDKSATPADQVEAVLTSFEALSLVSGHRDATVLITIDQMEELLGDGAQTKAEPFLHFLQALLNHEDAPVIVLGTLRSDFLGTFQTHPIFRDVTFESLPVNPLNSDAIAQVIQGPADLAGIDLEPGLRELLVQDAQGGNALPLLAFTLKELWQQYGEDGLLEIDEYQNPKKLGGLTGAIKKAAQTILDGYVRPDADNRAEIEEALRRAFLKLVRIDEEGKATRQPVTWQELPEAVHPLLQRFIGEKGRLLTISGEAGLVEVSHEALFTAWPLLAEWISGSKELLIYKQKLEAMAAEWAAEEQPKSLLLTGERLAIATSFIAENSEDFWLNPEGQAFVKASQQANATKEFFQKTLLAALRINTPLKQVLSLVAIARTEAAMGAINEAKNALEQALGIARGVSDSKEQGQMLVEIALVHWKLNHEGYEFETVFRLADGKSNTTYSIIEIARQMNDGEAAKAVLLKATTAADTIDKASDKRKALSTIAQATGQLNDRKAARAVLLEATTAAEKIDDASHQRAALSAIANAYSQLNDGEAAKAVLLKAITAAEKIDDASDQGKALSTIANATGQLSDGKAAKAILLKAIAAAEKIELLKAFTVFKRIDKANAQGAALRAIAQATGQLNDGEAAKAVLLKATTTAKEFADANSQSKALSAIANAYSQLNDGEAAKAVLLKATTAAEKIDNARYQSNALSEIANAYSQLNDGEATKAILLKATTAAEKFYRTSDQCDALRAIAQATEQLNDGKAAKAVLLKATTAAEKIDDATHQGVALSAIAQATGQLNDGEAAKAVLLKATTAAEKINNTYHQGFALGAITQATGRLNDWEAAKAVLLKATTAAEKIDHASSQSKALCAITNAYSKLNDEETAKAVLLKATTAAEKIDDARYQRYALSAIAQATGQLNDGEVAKAILLKAIATAEKIENAYEQREALSAIAQATGQMNDGEAVKAVLLKATTAAEKIAYAESQSTALIAIANAYSQLNDGETAKAVLLKATTAAEKIDNPYDKHDKCKALSAIAQATGQLNDGEAAKSVLLKATTAAKKIDDADDQSKALSTIANAYSQLNDREAATAVLLKAITAAEKIDGADDQSKALSTIFEVEDELDISERFLDDIPEDPVELTASLEQILITIEDDVDWSNVWRHRALLEVTEVMKQLTNLNTAKPLLEKSLTSANELTLPEFRDRVLAAIALTYGHFALWDDALKTLEPLPDDEKTDALTQILDLWVEHHKAAIPVPSLPHDLELA